MITALALCLLVLLAACGGSDKPFQAAPITCDPLDGRAYRFKTQVVLEVKEADQTPVPAGVAGPNPFRYVQDIEGAVQGKDSAQAVMRSQEASNRGERSVVAIGDSVWLKVLSGWRLEPPGGRKTDLIPYRPLTGCKALAPDFDPTSASGQAEEVSDIRTHRYDLNGLQSGFFAHHPDFGVGSDAGSMITELQGSVWVADEGGYISKLQVTGTGSYPNGRKLVVELSYEVSDYNGAINIEPPI